MWLGYVYLNNSLRRGEKYCKRFDFITNGYGVPSTGGSFSTIHWDSATQYLNKETKRTFGHSAQAISDIHTVKKNRQKLHIFTARSEHYTTRQEIDKEVVDGLLHAQEVRNKHFETFLQEKLVEPICQIVYCM